MKSKLDMISFYVLNRNITYKLNTYLYINIMYDNFKVDII